MFHTPAHKNRKAPPGQHRDPIKLPEPLPFGHDRRLPRRLKKKATK